MRRVVLAIGMTLSALATAPAGATAIADSSLQFSGLSIVPAAGFLSLDGEWQLEAFASANNSLGESDSEFDSASSPGSVSQQAAVTWAAASASASAPDTPPDLDVRGAASSSVSIPGCVNGAAFAAGDALLSNSFTISGVGDVEVSFGADVAGALHVFTDACGLNAHAETIFNLQVDGNTVLLDHRTLDIGPSSADSLIFSERLINSVVVAAGVSHSLQMLVDAEASGFNAPEPGVVGLLLLGGSVGLWTRRRRPLGDDRPGLGG